MVLGVKVMFLSLTSFSTFSLKTSSVDQLFLSPQIQTFHRHVVQWLVVRRGSPSSAPPLLFRCGFTLFSVISPLVRCRSWDVMVGSVSYSFVWEVCGSVLEHVPIFQISICFWSVSVVKEHDSVVVKVLCFWELCSLFFFLLLCVVFIYVVVVDVHRPGGIRFAFFCSGLFVS